MVTKRLSKRARLLAERNVSPEAAFEWYRGGPVLTKSRGWWRWGMRKDHRYNYDVWGDTRAETLKFARNAEHALGGI